MSELNDQLHRLEQAWRDQQMPICDHLRPGLDPEHVRERLVQKGFAPTDEVVKWWAWHDGVEQTDDAVLAHPGAELLTLEGCLDRHDRQLRARNNFDPGFDGWLPLLGVTNGSVIVVDCASGGAVGRTAYICRDLDLVDRYAAPDLVTPVSWWAEMFETRAWIWNPGGWIDDPGSDEDTFPERRRTDLL